MNDLTTLSLRREGAVAIVTLDREAARNAINLAMCQELFAVFDAFRFDSQLRVVVLRGRGPVFCAGVDIKEMKANPTAWGVERRHRGLDAYLAVERCPVPVIAGADGPAFGGGCELASAADFVLASSKATFEWPEARHGGVGATQRLPRLVGSAKARELLFTGRRVDAEEARRIGFVADVVSPEMFDARLEDIVASIAGMDTFAIRGIKRAMQAGEGCDRATAIDIERQAIEWAMAQERTP